MQALKLDSTLVKPASSVQTMPLGAKQQVRAQRPLMAGLKIEKYVLFAVSPYFSHVFKFPCIHMILVNILTLVEFFFNSSTGSNRIIFLKLKQLL